MFQLDRLSNGGPRVAALVGTFLLLSLFADVASASCGDGVFEPEMEDCDDGNQQDGDGCDSDCYVECVEIGLAATDHTCGHGAFGPFVSVTAQAYESSSSFIYSDVNAHHTYFTVAMSGMPGANQSAVLYYPVVSGVFAIYMREPFELQVLDDLARPQPVVLEHAVSTCVVGSSITWVRVYALSDTVEYRLVFGAGELTDHALAIEYLPSFISPWYRDADGDGQGGVELVAESWCRAPPPYSASDADCDDTNSVVFSGGVEVCDESDNDCDGYVDNGWVCAEPIADSGVQPEREDAGIVAQEAGSPVALDSGAVPIAATSEAALTNSPEQTQGVDAASSSTLASTDARTIGEGAEFPADGGNSEPGPVSAIPVATGSALRPQPSVAELEAVRGAEAGVGDAGSPHRHSTNGCDCAVAQKHQPGGPVLFGVVGLTCLVIARRRWLATERHFRQCYRDLTVPSNGSPRVAGGFVAGERCGHSTVHKRGTDHAAALR
jgi:cysteine-rich repeat protein